MECWHEGYYQDPRAPYTDPDAHSPHAKGDQGPVFTDGGPPSIRARDAGRHQISAYCDASNPSNRAYDASMPSAMPVARIMSRVA